MSIEKSNLDFIKRDNHLTKDEISEVKELSQDEEKLKIMLDTQKAFEDFINTEYKWANEWYLKKGGKSVRELQRALGGLTIDGDFGKNTFLAIIKFQRENGLVVDGLAGPNTQTRLFDHKRVAKRKTENIHYIQRLDTKKGQGRGIDLGALLISFFRQKKEKVNGTTDLYSEPDNLDKGEDDFSYLGDVDFRGLAYKYPREASLKNNNPAGLTYNSRFASTLRRHNIAFQKGTARPSSEGGNYFGFPNMEEGMKAYNLLWDIKINKMANKTFGDLASNWAVDTRSYRKQFGDIWNTKVSDLSDEQIGIIKRNQMKIESPGMYAELQNAGYDFKRGFETTSKAA